MKTLEELKKEKESKIQAEGDKLINSMTEGGYTDRQVSTCGTNSYGWNLEYHNNMPRVAEYLRSKGLKVFSNVKFGVTDWYISV